MTTTTKSNDAQDNHQPMTRAAIRYLFTVEMNASFAVSPTGSGALVAHVNWAGQTPVASWQDVAHLHRDTLLLPCFFDGALEALVDIDGWPSDDLTTEIFGAEWLRVARQATR